MLRNGLLYRTLVLATALSLFACAGKPVDRTAGERAAARERMVELLASRRIRDGALLEAMRTVPRHLFIPEGYRDTYDPYGDHPGPIGYGQTISQPYIVAYMTERMGVKPGEKILEIGTGSGYQAAILAALGAEVYSIEIIPELAEHARQVLKDQGFDNVRVLAGDGYRGWPDDIVFDAVIVTAAPAEIPRRLIEQLRDGGRMILPLGTWSQRLVICRKRGGEIEIEEDLPVRFVPMVRGEE
ncbi:MAG: protein-L-isoaspartate(D-aspartate) O-methyltransferase [Candidatus Erginobacter occultus]|nr:protein-L-isoaspartate(D-aspartate) O-methyltransferase [Candidatus Erginobacter occultus]